jgi:hypothetical protein
VKKLRLFFVITFCLVAEAGFSVDFGVLATINPDLKFDYSKHTVAEAITNDINLRAWVSAALGDKADLHVSAKAALKCRSLIWQWPLRFEAERTEFIFRPAPGMILEAGRMEIEDTSRMIAGGLFDGFRASLDTEAWALRFGAFYSGFMFKETAEIFMTPRDERSYAVKLHYDDPETYFASRRVLFSTDATIKMKPGFSLGLATLAQFDLNKDGEDPSDRLHTQYLSILPRWILAEDLGLSADAILGLAETDRNDTLLFFAASAGLDWKIKDRNDTLALDLHWAGGAHGNRIGPFEPVNVKAPGFAFNPRFSGVAVLSAAYNARPWKTVDLLARAAYFFRTDRDNFAFPDLAPQFDPGSDSPLLGAEIYGLFDWTPFSFLRFWIESGVFLPGFGRAFVADAENRWRVKAGLTLSAQRRAQNKEV